MSGIKSKRRGSSEERRLAVKLTKATGLWFERALLSGAGGKNHPSQRGDIVCNDQWGNFIEVKYRRRLTEASVRRGCKVIDQFLADLPTDLPADTDSLLIVVTGGGVNYRKKGMKKDWLFAPISLVNQCECLKGSHWIGQTCNYPFFQYKGLDLWAFASLDDVLAIEGSKELFIL